MRERRSSSFATVLALLIVVLVPALPVSAAATTPTNTVTFRAVLCYAPPLSKKTEFPLASALPTCTAKFQLTAKNLGVRANNSASGFKEMTVEPDPRFLRFRSTPSAKILSISNVLLPLINANANAKSRRYVLGPAQLTSSAIKSAKAVKLNLGQWVVTYRLTKAGAKSWDAFAKRQFHALIAIVANGEVYSAPVIQPTLSHFASFDGAGEISGAFTKTEAMDLAAAMQPKR